MGLPFNGKILFSGKVGFRMSLGRDHHHWSTIGDPHGRLAGDPQILVGDPHIFIGDT